MDLNVGKWLRSWLGSVTAVTALVGSRIYPGAIPQGDKFPALTYMQQDTELEADQDELTDAIVAKVRLFAWDDRDYDGAKAVLTAVVNALKDDELRNQVWGGLQAQACMAVLHGDAMFQTQDADQTLFHGPYLDLEITYGVAGG